MAETKQSDPGLAVFISIVVWIVVALIVGAVTPREATAGLAVAIFGGPACIFIGAFIDRQILAKNKRPK
ncbi:MAG TPA: hypothetical protein G4O03_01315 [Dehalococcoidia bacterium]|jgi:hypothetical protein|nr:hypothetical protein [Dehalococcoidia bacterium]